MRSNFKLSITAATVVAAAAVQAAIAPALAAPSPAPAASASARPVQPTPPAASPTAGATASPTTVPRAVPLASSAPNAMPSAALSSASSAPSPKLLPDTTLQGAVDGSTLPQLRGSLASGTRYIIAPLDGVPTVAAELWYRAPSGGYGPLAIPSEAWFAAETVAASAGVDGVTLSRFVQDAGGQLSIEVFPDALKIGIEIPSSEAPRAIAFLTHAYGTALTTDTGYKRAAFDLGTQALLERIDGLSMISDAAFTTLFSDGPDSIPTLDAATLPHVSYGDVQSFSRRAFALDNATLVLSGNVTPELLRNVADVPGAGSGREAERLSHVAPLPATHALEGSQPGYGLAWAGPGIDDERAATALDFIADYLFNDRDGTVTRAFTQRFPNVELAGQYVTFHEPGVFFVGLAGDGALQAAPVLDAAVQAMQTPLADDRFAVAREAFVAHLESTIDEPAGLAASLGWYDIEGNAGYAPGADGEQGQYFQTAWSLTPQSVAEAARRYLGTSPARVRLLTTPSKKAST